MARLIDADVLKQHIDKLPALPDGNFAGNHSALKALINMQPTIEPEPKWIPVSERLPEGYGEFLVTMTEKAKAKDLGFDIDETYIRKMRYNSNGWQLPRHIPSWINEAVKDEVLAWMPLPDPYQEEGEKDGKDT